MAKSEPAAPETSLGQAGLPPSYGVGIRENSYGNGRNYVGNPMLTPNNNINQSIMNGLNRSVGFGGPGQPGPMSGSGPSSDMMQRIMKVLMSMSGGGGGGIMDQYGGRNGMGGPRGTGYNFSTPISGANYFSGLPGAVTGSQVGQRLTDPNASKGGFKLTGK